MNHLIKIFFLIIFIYDQGFSQEKPNVVIIITDDQGYGELSIHGNPVLKTPHIDKLAKQSTQFSDFHTSPMCAPTRASLITGMDPARNGCINVSSGRANLRKELVTMADIFSSNGYETGIFGKWHMGDNYPYRPQDRGFKESIWFPSSHISSVPDYWGNDYFDDTYIHNGKREKFKGYCTDVFFDNAKKFMEQSKNQDKPFLAFVSTNTPHWPFFAKPEDIKAVRKAFEKSSIAKKDIPSYHGKEGLIKYLAMIRNIDTNVGQLRKFLDKNRLDKNTIFIFLTDNGSIFGPQYFNAGMRGQKTQFWEGGHRVPLFIHYPNGRFSAKMVDGLTQVQDILPTLVDICNLEVNQFVSFDGISLADQLKENIPVSKDRMLVNAYSRMPGGFEYPSPYGQTLVRKNKSVVLWKEWRLFENRKLYNLKKDPKQSTDLISKHPEIALKMRSHLDDWWDTVKDIANEPQPIIIGSDNENPMMLTACDWMDVFVDQQGQVKRGTKKNSYWLLDVEENGTYEFELRRWPKELDRPISSPEKGEQSVTIVQARLFIDNVLHQDDYQPYSYEGAKVDLDQKDKSAKFTVELKKGQIALHTWFDKKRNDTAFGAYYVYVKRI